MGLSGWLDAHFPTHGHWHGLPLGRMATMWLSAMLSRGDHRLVQVEPWVAGRQMMLSQVSGEIVRADDLSDDRLEIVLRLLRDDSPWTAFASALHQHLIRVYDLRAERVHVDSTSASTYAGVNDEGLLQCGHSKDHRPDLPQGKVRQAVVDPLGLPLATEVVSGNRAEDPLSGPCIARVQASVGRRGLWDVGDGKMASQQTRAWLATEEAYSLGPLPQVQRAEGELDTAWTALEQGEGALSPVYRESPGGESEQIAEGDERQVAMACAAHGDSPRWTERRLVVRSLRHAQAAAASLRTWVAKAQTPVEAWKQRGRGRKRFAEIDELRQAATSLVQRHHVEAFVWLRYEQQATLHPGRASRTREAGIKVERQATVEVRVDEDMLERAVRRLGWRLYVTKQVREQLSLEQAVLAYRSEYLVERSLGRRKGRPLSLTPMYGQRDEHATGLMRL